MAATTQTKKAVIDAVVAELKANSDVTDLAGNGVNSIFQYHDEDKLNQAFRARPGAISPALIVFSENSNWVVSGNTHDRNINYFVDVQVWDPKGFGARLDKNNNITEKIYETLIGNTLGLTNPQLTKIEPVNDEYVGEMTDGKGKEMNTSIWRIKFTVSTDWQN